MPRAIEDYICASEDRSHYDNETYGLWGFEYPMRSPRVITFVNETKIIKEKVSEEEINQLIDARIQGLTQTVVNEVKETIADSIDEVHGGSATEVIPQKDGG